MQAEKRLAQALPGRLKRSELDRNRSVDLWGACAREKAYFPKGKTGAGDKILAPLELPEISANRAFNA